jgi:hypothetical protein
MTTSGRVWSIVPVAIVATLLAAQPAGAGFLGLLAAARHKVTSKKTFANARLLEADGLPSSGQATTAADVNRWRFVFNNQATPGSRFKTAFLSARNGRLGNVRGFRSVFVEDRQIGRVPMSLPKAIRTLRDAGYTMPFQNVTLRYPLGPGFTEPLYIFGFDPADPFVGVGVRTGSIVLIE